MITTRAPDGANKRRSCGINNGQICRAVWCFFARRKLYLCAQWSIFLFYIFHSRVCRLLPVYPDDVYASICLHVEWILVQAAEEKAKYFQNSVKYSNILHKIFKYWVNIIWKTEEKDWAERPPKFHFLFAKVFKI